LRLTGKKIEEQFGDYGFEEMVESIEPDEEGNRDYLTVIEDEVKSDAKEDSEVYKLDESEKVEYSSDNIDQINRLYVGAYTVKKDFEKLLNIPEITSK